jgi:hypothetical protein
MICAAVLLQLLINTRWLIPAPVGDASFFLAVSANYCQTGFFGSTALNVDPSGQSRMIWHGFCLRCCTGLSILGANLPYFT